MKIRVQMGKALLAEAKEAAVERRISLSELIRDALWNQLNYEALEKRITRIQQLCNWVDHPVVAAEIADRGGVSVPRPRPTYHGATREWCRRVVDPIIAPPRILQHRDTPEEVSEADHSQGRTGADRVLADA